MPEAVGRPRLSGRVANASSSPTTGTRPSTGPNVDGRRPAHRADRGRRRGHRGRASAPGRRPDLRHRVLDHRFPLPHRRSPGSGGRTLADEWRDGAARLPGHHRRRRSPTATCSTGPTPTWATTRSCSWSNGRSTSSSRPWPSRPRATGGRRRSSPAVGVTDEAYRRDDRAHPTAHGHAPPGRAAVAVGTRRRRAGSPTTGRPGPCATGTTPCAYARATSA